MAKSFKDDMRSQMFKNISQFSSRDADAGDYTSQSYNDAAIMSSEMGESKSAKNQFRKDLQKDFDFNEFKKRARSKDEFTGDEFEYGTPNVVDNDPFITKKRYQRVGKEDYKELDEKWSEKYKKSIDCNNPKGFSQKAHCQGRKKKESNEATGAASAGAFELALSESKKVKKVETKEATGSSSVGSYSQPSIWAKNMSKKNFRGYDKPQLPGGKFVTVKKKCKTFPYCNQGDIKSLKIWESETVKNVIKRLAEKHNISEGYAKFIIENEIRNKQK